MPRISLDFSADHEGFWHLLTLHTGPRTSVGSLKPLLVKAFKMLSTTGIISRRITKELVQEKGNSYFSNDREELSRVWNEVLEEETKARSPSNNIPSRQLHPSRSAAGTGDGQLLVDSEVEKIAKGVLHNRCPRPDFTSEKPAAVEKAHNHIKSTCDCREASYDFLEKVRHRVLVLSARG